MVLVLVLLVLVLLLLVLVLLLLLILILVLLHILLVVLRVVLLMVLILVLILVLLLLLLLMVLLMVLLLLLVLLWTQCPTLGKRRNGGICQRRKWVYFVQQIEVWLVLLDHRKFLVSLRQPSHVLLKMRFSTEKELERQNKVHDSKH